VSKFFDFNYNRGTWYEYDYDEQTDNAIVSIKQDVQPVLDLAKDERNSGINDKVGDFSKYAVIPAHVEVALKQRGINIYDQNQTKELLKVINQEYPLLKTTNLHHEIK
jgi:hypothetical protein